MSTLLCQVTQDQASQVSLGKKMNPHSDTQPTMEFESWVSFYFTS